MTKARDLARVGSNAEYGLNFRNRIINGDMRIDQRNAGASVNPSTSIPTYMVDRWVAYQDQTSKFTVQQNAGGVTAPAGFTNYLGYTSSSAYTVTSGQIFATWQAIEGYNIADLGWGTANAKTVTLSFWVRSSLTGTFGGALKNTGTRSYPFSYTISSANTWEQKVVTVAGDTSGTWNTTNGVGIYVNFGLGVGSSYSGTAGAWSGSNLFSTTGATSVVGTNGATFYLTGVQLEVGSSATPFDTRAYGTELALCQRYYEKSYNIDVAPATDTLAGAVNYDSTSGTYARRSIVFAVSKRANPTVTLYSKTGTSGQMTVAGVGTSASSFSQGMSGAFAGTGTTIGSNAEIIYHWTASIEL